MSESGKRGERDSRPPEENLPVKVRFSETAEVFVREDGAHRIVPVSDAAKPAISERMRAAWRQTLDRLALALDVRAVLVMRITRDRLQAFACSTATGSLYPEGASFPLGSGLLCEEVIGRNCTLQVADTAHSPAWRNDPSVERGMEEYCGVPLHWADGSFFGTLCVFGPGDRTGGETARELIGNTAAALEKDLEALRLSASAEPRDNGYAEAADALFRYAPGGIFSYSAEEDEQFSFLSVNMLAFLGYSREEFVRKFQNRFSHMVFPEDRRRVLAEIDEQIRHGSFDTCEYRIERKDGSIVWVHDEGHIVTDENGKRWFYVVIVDITDSIDAKEKLIVRNRELETAIRDLQTTVDKIPGGIRVFKRSADGIVCVNANQYYADMLGIPKAELIGESFGANEARIHPDDVDRHRREMASCFDGGSQTEGTYRFFSARTGEYRWYHLEATSEGQADGSVLAYFHYTDVDDLKRAEADVQTGRQQYELAVKGAHLAVWEYDIASRRLSVPEGENSGYALARYGFASNVIENVPECMLPMGLTDADRENFLQLYREIRAGREYATADIWFRRESGGEPRCDRITYYVVRDGAGRPVRAYGVGSDVTAEKQGQLRFEQSIQSILNANPEALCTFQLNLTKNRCLEGHGASPDILHALQADTADGLFQNGLALVPFPEDRERFGALFNRPQLEQAFAAGSASLYLDYRRSIGGCKPFWVRTYISLLKNPGTDDLEGVIYSLDISREKQRSEIFNIITNQELDYVALLHASAGQIEFLNLNSRLNPKYQQAFGRPGELHDFDAVRRFTVQTWIDPLDRAAYLRASPVEEVRRELDRSGHCEFSVRGHYLDHPERMMCRKIQHYYLGDDRDTILIIQTDVTETYQRQQQDLERAETETRRVQDILDYISSGVCVLVMPDPEHLNIQYSNRQMPRMLGFASGEQSPAQVGEGTDGGVAEYFASAFSGVHPDDLPRVREAYRKGYDQERFSVPEFRLLTGSGTYIWVSVDVALREQRPAGKVFYGTYRDVSREVALRRELAEQQKKRLERTLVDTVSGLPSSSVLFRIRDDNSLAPEQYSDEFRRMAGYAPQEEPCRSVAYDNVHPEDRSAVSRFVTDHLRDSRPFRSVYRIRTKRDAYMWVSVTFNTFRFGNARYLYAQYTDIDDVKRQEELLEEQYNAAQTFLDSVAGSYLVARRANLTRNRVETIQGTNPLPQVAAEKNYDLSMALLLQAIPGEEERRECEAYFTRSALLRAFEAGKRSLSREYQYRSPEGEVKWVRSTITLTRRPGSGDVIAFSAASDITEEKLIRAVMDQVVAKQYDYFCCIDAAHDRISLLVSNTETLPPSRVGSGTPYEASVRAYNNEYVVPAERESCNAFMSLAHVTQALEASGRCFASFAMLEGGQRRIKQVEFFPIDRAYSLIALVRTDYTEAQRKQLEQAERLRSALEAAQHANEAKSEFLSRMSHDMRTPLNGIIGMTYLTEELDLPAQARDNLHKIDTSSKFLLSLINDVLDMAKAESKKVELHPEPYPPQEFYGYLDAVIRPLCREKDQTFLLDANPAADRVPLFDKLRINQVVFNLLSNAVKYTPEGGTVSYRAHFGPAGPDGRIEVCIEVGDNGVGMSEEFQKVLFEPFTQENRVDASEQRGTGLGLAITKRLMDLMGGTISVSSRVGIGTTFTLRLCVDSIPAEALPKRTAGASFQGAGALRGRRVLLCEDHPLNREIAGTLLREKGVSVEEAENGQEGVERFRQSPAGFFDAVLMDIRMPVLDGYAAARAIRALPRPDAGTVPIIAMTADAFADDIRRCLEAGMNGHLSKPVDPGQLYRTLLSALGDGPVSDGGEKPAGPAEME
jgi:PAS domain S-box-containing protein